MNGALFAAWRVIFNFLMMVNCGKSTKHPLYRQVGVFIFMMYYLFNQLMLFVIVGIFYLCIKIFLR